MPLIPARLEFAADGTPWSEEFGDVYHSAAGGPAQARHVFLAGNRLPERWAGRERFVILETGFGFGLNFLATWQAWRRDPARCGRLHFVSVEKHPFTLSNLRVLHSRYPEFENEAAQLHACWPMLVPGAHRLALDAGRVGLTLLVADIKLLRELQSAAHGAPRNTSAGGLGQPCRQLPSARYARRQRFRAPDEIRFSVWVVALEKTRKRPLGPLRRSPAGARREGRGLAARLDRRARLACRVRAIRDARGGERARRRAGGGGGFVVSRGGVDPAAVAGERAARSSRDEARTNFRQGNTFD